MLGLGEPLLQGSAHFILALSLEMLRYPRLGLALKPDMQELL
jgi:hypothetical protein